MVRNPPATANPRPVDASPRAAIILAAGLGTRMRSDLPKVLHPVAGRPMVEYVLAAVAGASPIVGVIAPDQPALAAAFADHVAVFQRERLGTGHAALQAAPALAGFAGVVLILAGDVPMIEAATLDRLVEALGASDRPAIAVAGFRPPDPGAYGRLIEERPGRLARIVEARDASAMERAVGLCNAGVYAVEGASLFGWLAGLGANNAQGEYYLTDIVAAARAEGRAVAVVETAADEVLGVNSRADLAAVEAVAQARARGRAMAGGVTLMDPASVHFSFDTVIGRDVVIEPHVFFGPGVTIGDDVRINAFSHLAGARVETGAVIGPFARLRPGTVIGPGAHVGNFVELKAASLGAGAKANHLSYLGDAEIGPRSNIGAGVITCNYDGFVKSKTHIGADAFIGSNAALVAPVSVGDRAIIGAGATITRDVPADALAVARADQEIRPEAASRYRAKRRR